MATICQKCGDRGFAVALIYCDGCQASAEHRYCLDVLPATFDEYVTWLCEECDPKVRKLSTINKARLFPCGLSHSADPKKLQAIESRVGLKEENSFRRSKKNIKIQRKKKIKDINAFVAKMDMQFFESIPPLPFNEMHCGGICKEGQKHGQELRLLMSDGSNSDENVDCISPSLQCNEMQCDENGKEGQKLGHKLGLDLKDGAKLDGEADYDSSSLQHNQTHCSENCEKGQKLGQEFQLDPTDGTNPEEKAESVITSQIVTTDASNILEHTCYTLSQPIIYPIWQGSLCICNKSSNAVSLVAHLSSLACSKVCEEANLMPQLLRPELLCRSDVWPKSFQKSGPTDQSIALYFFPHNKSDSKPFESLVDIMIGHDLALRSVVQNAELLVFPSTQLPSQYQRFQGNHYLWGVFREKQALHVTTAVVPEVEKNHTNALSRDRWSSILVL